MYILSVGGEIVKKLSLAIVSTMLVLSMTGCGTDQATNNQGGENMGHGNNMENHGVETKSMNPNTNSNINSYDNAIGNGNNGNGTSNNANQQNDRHRQLTENIRNVEGVNDSTVLIDGDTMIIGLDLDNNADRAQVEKEVRRVLGGQHNAGTVHITIDGTHHERIRTLNNQMNEQHRDGQPLRNMANDIRTLIDDIGQSVERAVR